MKMMNSLAAMRKAKTEDCVTIEYTYFIKDVKGNQVQEKEEKKMSLKQQKIKKKLPKIKISSKVKTVETNC